MRALFALLLFALHAQAAPVPKEVKRDPLGQLVGLWEVASNNDSLVPGKRHCFRFNPDGSASSEVGGTIYKYSFAILPDAKAPMFTWIWDGGSQYNALYRLEGDSLTIVFTDVKKAVPKEVKPGVGDAYYELKRVK